MPKDIDAMMLYMRTTLTLDDEVALGLSRMQKRFPDRSFKDIVNEVIKVGLAANGDMKRVPFKVKPLKNTKPKPGLNFDNVNALIAQIEGDSYK